MSPNLLAGMSDEQLNKILDKHDKDIANLATTQDEEKEKQTENFKVSTS